MQNKGDFSDRRDHQRYSANLALALDGTDFKIRTDTKNLSGSGLYCQVDRFIPVMTKLSLAMIVPLISERQKVEARINCEGVVVRVEPQNPQESSGTYNIGLFFTDIKESDRRLITQYLRQAFWAGNN